MAEQRVGIIAECICDLPKSFFKEHNVSVLYFHVKTESGVFTDTDEITAENIIGYMESGDKVPVSSPPPPEEYEKIFRRELEKYGEVIFIATGSGASGSFEKASKAVSAMGGDGKNVHVVDSWHLSTGLGHIIIRAAELAEAGASADEIISELEELRNRVSTTFIARNADYLYRNGRVSKNVKRVCDIFGIHPVLKMKDGSLMLKSIMLGNYERASLRYVRRILKKPDVIEKKRIFITHVGCGSKRVERIKAEIGKRCPAEKIIVTRASATISSNCGPGTFGVMFVNEK